MLQVTQAAAVAAGSIMVVDDNPTNLTLLEEMLRQQGYEVRSLPRGRMAIVAASQEQPDLILLDINMPEMNGYEVCERLKASEALAGIPVIFLSALTGTEDKVKGFRAGGVDYISKPFHMEEVQARVSAHLGLRRAQQAEHTLLEKTLGGAVAALWELADLTSPALALRSDAVRDIVSCITRRRATPHAWQYDLAARLCLLGCIAVPEEIFERAYAGQKLSSDEERIFRAHPERAARLLSRIPRLEGVAAMIQGQQTPGGAPGDPVQTEGMKMLHLALALDRRIYLGIPCRSAIAEMRMSNQFDSGMLDALDQYSPPKFEFESRRLPLCELRSGMILRQDVLSDDGRMLILKNGTVLSEIWIERLENFATLRNGGEFVDVQIPNPAAPASGANRAE